MTPRLFIIGLMGFEAPWVIATFEPKLQLSTTLGSSTQVPWC